MFLNIVSLSTVCIQLFLCSNHIFSINEDDSDPIHKFTYACRILINFL